MKDKLSNLGAIFEEKLMPIADKISTQRHLSAIRDGMLSYMPFTIIASFFLIVAFFPIPGYLEVVSNVFGVSDPWIWQEKLMYVGNATLDIGGIYVVIAVSYALARTYKVNKLQAALTAVASFLALTPYVWGDRGGTIIISYIGIKAMFLAITVALVSVEIYRKIEQKGIVIKMPESVPPAVAAPFASLIPAFITILFFYSIRILFEVGLKSDVLTIVNTFIGAPLNLLGGTLVGLVIALIIQQTLWFFGIHGGAIVAGTLNPIWTVLEDENRLASIAGVLPKNIINLSFVNHFTLGVVGSVIAILIVAKSRQYKETGKLASVPYAFNIGEPVLFGIPLMLNPIYLIPMIFTNAISAVISYFAFAAKLVPIPTGLAQLPWTTPPIISGFFVTGDIRGSILQIVLLAVATLIWIPFVKIADKQIYGEELKNDHPTSIKE